MYHFKTKQSTPAAKKPIPHVSAIVYPRFACSFYYLTRSGTQETDDDSASTLTTRKIGSSRSIPGSRGQKDCNSSNNNTTDSLVNLEWSASGNLLFRRCKQSSVDEQQRHESRSRARAQDLYSEYEHTEDKDETLNTSKGNFKNSESAITAMAPSLCSSILTVKQAQALSYAKHTNKQQTISDESREEPHQKQNEDESLVKKEIYVESSNIGSSTCLHTPSRQQTGTEICVSNCGVLLKKNPDGVLMVQSNRISYGKNKFSSSRRSAQIEKSLKARRALNSINNMVVEKNLPVDDSVECCVPKSSSVALSSAGFNLYSMTKMPWDDDSTIMQPVSHGHHFHMSTIAMPQLPELC